MSKSDRIYRVLRGASAAAFRMFELSDPVVRGDYVKTFFGRAGANLIQRGGLVKVEQAKTVIDDDGNMVDVSFRDKDRSWGYFSLQDGWVKVPPLKLVMYALDFSWMADIVKAAIGISMHTKPETVLDATLWHLGKTLVGSQEYQFFLARKVDCDDNLSKIDMAVRNKLGKAKAIVFSTVDLPALLHRVLPENIRLININDCVDSVGLYFKVDMGIVAGKLNVVTQKAEFSEGFRTVTYESEVYHIGKMQAAFVEYLHLNGSSDKSEIMAGINSKQDEPKGLWRPKGIPHPLWGTLIKNDGKGNYWLDL